MISYVIKDINYQPALDNTPSTKTTTRVLTLTKVNWYISSLENSVDPDQLASSDLYCFPISKSIYILIIEMKSCKV